jgi:hypothetical protein
MKTIIVVYAIGVFFQEDSDSPLLANTAGHREAGSIADPG